MAEVKRILPDFNKPPVIEVVLGVYFAPVESFSVEHFGLFWSKVRREYPTFVPQPPLPTVVEGGFEADLPPQPSIGLEVIAVPPIRGWFIDSSKARLMQVQRDRFCYNWRKVQGDDAYPHYINIEPKFRSEWERFNTFLQEESLGMPVVNQCEVTYVNHLEIGSGWKTYGEFNNVLACWSGATSEPFLPEPEKVVIMTQYVMEDKRGRLYINVQPAIRRIDAKEVIKVELTARGKPNSPKIEDILEWFELGHKWIVRGFTSFTTRAIHKLWERTV